jgi:ferredoxin-NADP reductase
LAVVRKIPCTVETVVHHCDRVYTVVLRPDATAPRFKPGQFLHLALDAYEPAGFWPESRVFSIASAPIQRDLLSITYTVRGAFTARMESELAEGRRVWIKLPYGDFIVSVEGDAVLFAGGTGITAFTAFLESRLNTSGARILLCYGARSEELLVYGDLADECSRCIPGFEARMFAEDRDGRLSVEAVSDVIAELRDPAFYLSGPHAMLDALTSQLKGRGVPGEAIKTDAWE